MRVVSVSIGLVLVVAGLVVGSWPIAVLGGLLVMLSGGLLLLLLWARAKQTSEELDQEIDVPRATLRWRAPGRDQS